MRRKHAIFICAAILCIAHVITGDIAARHNAGGIGEEAAAAAELPVNHRRLHTPGKQIRRLRNREDSQAAQKY